MGAGRDWRKKRHWMVFDGLRRDSDPAYVQIWLNSGASNEEKHVYKAASRTKLLSLIDVAEVEYEPLDYRIFGADPVPRGGRGSLDDHEYFQLRMRFPVADL
ncbi:hypothetical protein [Methylobacterium sp. 13MFTsu3.1M2]|uniref:hypothetical protein n=1 Tax=Methylobacterium sp. 13MFTsu3.1M2 TaxID=1502776 RepID=UPI00111484C8|nr:hypothetical protein [Methylobacterium sp. 13MFTsu3.1M2]